MPTFLENIDLLTVDQYTYVDTDEGKKLVARVALLTQLRNAVSFDLGVGVSSSSFGSRPTINSPALDLLNEIERQATEALRVVDPRPTPYGPVEDYVRRWFAGTTEDRMYSVTVKHQHSEALTDIWYRAWVARGRTGSTRSAVYFEVYDMTAWQLAQRWVDAIDGLFNPPSLAEIEGKCPSCEEEYFYRRKDGQTVRSKALAFMHNEQGESTEACCLACRASWAPDQFPWLLATLAKADADAKKAAAEAKGESAPEVTEPEPLPTIAYHPSYCVGCYHKGHTDYINLTGRCACDCHTEEAA